jgi:hypothetical protein
MLLIFPDGSGVVVDETGAYHPADYVITEDGEHKPIPAGTYDPLMVVTLSGAYNLMCNKY